jgi:Fe-S cluster assembly protein SufD
LEIYADDVKCSHGATVGQLDGEAVMYMRQRGLSEQQARRLQIEGFVNDIVLSAGDMGEVLSEELTAKLERL